MCAIAQNTPSRVSDESLESLLQRLDNAVEHCEQYRKVREERISALMSALGTAKLWAETPSSADYAMNIAHIITTLQSYGCSGALMRPLRQATCVVPTAIAADLPDSI